MAAANLCATRRQANDFYAVFFQFLSWETVAAGNIRPQHWGFEGLGATELTVSLGAGQFSLTFPSQSRDIIAS